MYDTDRKYWDPKIELMNIKEIKILQERRLRRVVNYVYSRSAFYRKKLDEVGLKPKHIKTLKDMNKIPLTDKYEMRDSVERSLNQGKLPFSEFLTVPEEQVVPDPARFSGLDEFDLVEGQAGAEQGGGRPASTARKRAS